MQKPITMAGGNGVTPEHLEAIKTTLETGQAVVVYASVIGHTRACQIQEEYNRALAQIFGDRLQATIGYSSYEYEYTFSLKS